MDSHRLKNLWAAVAVHVGFLHNIEHTGSHSGKRLGVTTTGALGQVAVG